MATPTSPSYAGHRFPAEIISHAVWLYFRFPLSLRNVDELLVARSVTVSHEIVRQWGLKFGQGFASQVRRRLPRAGDKWHLDEVAVRIAGVKHWLWRAVDQDGMVLDLLVQSRRDKRAAKRLLRKLLKKQCRPPRVMVTDKLASYGAAKREINARCRAPTAQGSEQLGGELASADPKTRTPDEAVQVSPACTTLPLSPRSGQQPLPPPRSPPCCPVPSRPNPRLPDLGRSDRRCPRGVSLSAPDPRCGPYRAQSPTS
jgi:putative transposase